MCLFPPITACVCISCRELDALLVEQCTVDTDTTTGQSVPAVIGNYREIPHTVHLCSIKETSSLYQSYKFIHLKDREQKNIMVLTYYAPFTIHKKNLFLCDI